MMDQPITLRVRPGETVRFPALCVACGQPARERLTLQKRRGQITRRVDAPLCAECARQLARRSGQEERFLRLSWPAAAIATLLLAVLIIVGLPLDPWWPRLLTGAIVGLIGGALVRWAMARRAAAAELPEKRAVSQAAQIVDFSWRDMTLALTNAGIADRVREMNAAVLVKETNAANELPPPADEVSES